jgi:hypothetical protein
MKLRRAFYLSGIASFAVLAAAPALADEGASAASSDATADQQAPAVVDQADAGADADENEIIVVATRCAARSKRRSRR